MSYLNPKGVMERIGKQPNHPTKKESLIKAKKGGHKQGEREVRSKKAGFYVAGHKNYGDVYEK